MNVSFRLEGVDWNILGIMMGMDIHSLLPLGRSGLKRNHHLSWLPRLRLLPLGRSGLKHWMCHFFTSLNTVSFRLEGVDWNVYICYHIHMPKSPSAWKEWIETSFRVILWRSPLVSFRLEGVDWNINIHSYIPSSFCLLPLGRSGLKLQYHFPSIPLFRLLPLGRSGLKRQSGAFRPCSIRVSFRLEGVDWNSW